MALKLIVMCLPEWLRPTDGTSFRYRACPSPDGAVALFLTSRHGVIGCEKRSTGTGSCQLSSSGVQFGWCEAVFCSPA
jgi:hypothetical protein